MSLGEYTREEGYNENELIQFGSDHLWSASVLLECPPRCYHSAGYLIHLGLELLLKAWVLHAEGKFPNTHDLIKLYKRLKPHLSLKKEQEDSLTHFQRFFTLRYPKGQHPAWLGDGDLERVHALLNALGEQMPAALRCEWDSLSTTQKGGMQLMGKSLSRDTATENALNSTHGVSHASNAKTVRT